MHNFQYKLTCFYFLTSVTDVLSTLVNIHLLYFHLERTIKIMLHTDERLEIKFICRLKKIPYLMLILHS